MNIEDRIKAIEVHLGITHELKPQATSNILRDNKIVTLEWSHTLLEGKIVTYAEAEKAIKALGSEWRMPTRKELESILDFSRNDPAIDTEKFPDTQSEWYWTSTPCAWNTSAVWVVHFSGGYVYVVPRGSSACVRAVRAV